MSIDHELRPECAMEFALLKAAAAAALRADERRAEEYREIRSVLAATREDVIREVSTLKERARSWGAIGGVIGSTVMGLLAALLLAGIGAL